MFHNSTTIRRYNPQTSYTGRGARMVNVNMTWDDFKVGAFKFGHYLGKPWRVVKKYSGIGLASRLGWKATKATSRAVEQTGRTAWEVGMGAKDSVANFFTPLIGATASDIKRTLLWNVPIQSVKSGVKSAIGVLKGPWNAIKGVRAQVGGVLKNTGDIISNTIGLRGREVIKSTRNLIVDQLYNNPITYAAKPIYDEAKDLGKEIALAKYQYVEGVRQAYGNVVDGVKRMINAPKKVNDYMKQSVARRENEEAQDEIKKQQRRAKKAQEILGIDAEEAGMPPESQQVA